MVFLFYAKRNSINFKPLLPNHFTIDVMPKNKEKSMKKVLTLISIIFSFSALSAGYERVEKSFTIRHITDFGSQVYYNCDSVENKTEQLLESLGAIVYSVRCTGGLDVFGRFHMPARVKVEFEALKSEIDGGINSIYDVVSIRDFHNCHLNNSILNGVKDSLDILNIETRRCLRSSDRTRIEVSVLTEN